MICFIHMCMDVLICVLYFIRCTIVYLTFAVKTQVKIGLCVKKQKETAHFCLCVSGLLEKLSEMSVQLEEIQKALDMYLETKRQLFPRFYFLSNDDVLEILGQSQNPEALQPHLKKCFDNIKSLRMQKATFVYFFISTFSLCGCRFKRIRTFMYVFHRWAIKQMLSGCLLLMESMLSSTNQCKWTNLWRYRDIMRMIKMMSMGFKS